MHNKNKYKAVKTTHAKLNKNGTILIAKIYNSLSKT